MTTKPQAYSQFTVTSECLCYGELHNIWQGASSPIQEFPASVVMHDGGTVKAQKLQHNVRAKNGTWNAFQLLQKGTDSVCAWFVCHSDVDPEVEIDKILRVSGSPYEFDSGSKFNNEETAAEGVIVINRYDWGYYDNRGKQEIGVDDEADLENFDTRVFGEGAGLVDYRDAKAEVLRWKEKEPHEVDTQPNSIWMFIRGGEYKFGRFGFDDAHAAARSFLFFTTHTYFTDTTFLGPDRTLRQVETPKDRFQRLLREGYNFEGLDTLERMVNMWPHIAGQVPLESELLGRYESHESLFNDVDIDAIRNWPGARIGQFADSWKEICYNCLNEMIMSYLEHYIPPASTYETVDTAANVLFPRRSGRHFIDAHMHSFMLQPGSIPIPDYDNREMRRKIKSFLIPLCEDNCLVRDDAFIAGISACIMYLLLEILCLSTNASLDNYRDKLVPADIRLATVNDNDLLCAFGYSRVFWKGTGQASQVAESSHTTEAAQAVE